MRILVDASCWENRRGYGRFTREITAALVQNFSREHEFVLLTDRDTAARNRFPGEARVESVATSEQPIQAAASGRARTVADILRFAWVARRHRADVVFFPAPYTYFPILDGTPMVLCLHDAMTEKRPDLFFATRQDRLRWRIKLSLARRQARCIVSPSEQARRDVARAFGIPPAKIGRIGEAAAAGFVPIDDAATIRATLERYGLATPPPIVLYVGAVSPHKNIEGLARAFARLESACQLVIVGEIENDSYLGSSQQVRSVIDTLDLGGRVSCLGYVPDADLAALYSAAALLVQPSLHEGFGLPVLEAMACGTPVAVSAREALLDLVGDAGLLFDPESIEDMAATIDRLLRDGDLRRDLRQRGLAKAREYSWKSAAEQTMSVLMDVAVRSR
jgi:glycosyltransferase involved in cell wall biosynthesis